MSVTINDKHTATAQVGKDTIENAEYLTFERCDWWNPKKKNVFEKAWDVITTPYYKAKHWIRDTYWQVYYGFQRMFKGYDAVDTFETFAKFTERYEKILKDYKKYHYGYPGDMTEEAWESVVDDMIYHLHYMDEQNVEDELSKGMPEGWVPSCITVDQIMERHKDEFFKLFSKHFYNLWD